MGTIKVKNSDFLSPEELAHTPDDKVCIICTGSQGEPLANLSRIANGTHRFIHLKPGDTIVFSSNPIPETNPVSIVLLITYLDLVLPYLQNPS